MKTNEETRKPKGDEQIPKGIPNRKSLHGHKSSGFGNIKPFITRQSSRIEMSQRTKQVKLENVMEKVHDMRRLRLAWQQVKGNAGSAGIDRMTVEEFGMKEQELLPLIQEKLKTGTYKFKPARRVEIPKPGSKKTRNLGIPTVMDRIVSQSINLVFEEIFDKEFLPSNFGFRRGKSQHRAIGHVRQAVLEGYIWCASIDLKSFFDEIPHDLILKLIRRRVKDEQLVTLIARALKAGVMINGNFVATTKGCPQGAPLSPMLSNIVLNELDQELEKRNLKFARWADDFIVLLKSERAAKRVMENIMIFLEQGLNLPVNKEKSQVARTSDVEFLGFQIYKGKLRISKRARNKFKIRAKELTRRNNPVSMFKIIQQLNEYLLGWVGYYRVQEFRQIFGQLDGYIRQRLRSMQLKKWKKPKKFQRMMIRMGYTSKVANSTWVNMKRWRSVNRPEVKTVLPNEWFKRLGLVFLDNYTNRNLEFNFKR
ncbi:MAG: group II intron reverse transcriptase/maturase [Thermodesulfobacteriota bacterium]